MKSKIPKKEVLKKLMGEFGSMGKVAAELGKPYGTVRTWFNKYGLDRPKSCRNIYHELRSVGFSDKQKSVVLGSILGDGGLQIPKKGKNAKLTIKHCTKQKPYLEWKKRLLDPFSRPIYKSSDPGPVTICGTKSYSSGSFVAYTITHPTLTDFYGKYYVDGRKRVHESVIDDLDMLSLSIWVADDGTFYSNKQFKNVVGGKICTNSFYYNEQLILIQALKKFYGDSGINVIPHNREKNQFVIRLTNSKAMSRLLRKIRQVLPACIHYKLDPQRLNAKPLN